MLNTSKFALLLVLAMLAGCAGWGGTPGLHTGDIEHVEHLTNATLTTGQMISLTIIISLLTPSWVGWIRMVSSSMRAVKFW